ncbi:hypothetical protein OE88DRAFT_1666010 [Heliocybe sulcata]|uniref:Uncharacterized protein n=1 Tax=Heliocybe sulcata TaxID=5364 RepID=A0A5C3MPG1_9AGAM|nr:hypothetical protein OE88DRAFT_1666010 [Heliocybe sulcata]
MDPVSLNELRPAMNLITEPATQLGDLVCGLQDLSLKDGHGKTDAGHLFPEILCTIFSFAFDCVGNGFAMLPKIRTQSSQLSLRDKTSCSMVCKHWRDAAVPMLYEHVVLHCGWQLSIFLRTLNSQSDSFNYRRLVKSLDVDLDAGYDRGVDCDQILEDILSVCPNLAEMAYNPSPNSGAVRVMKRLDPSLLTCLWLGDSMRSESSPDLFHFLQELPKLEVLSMHYYSMSEYEGLSLRLPHVTTLSLICRSWSAPTCALSTPSLTQLSITFSGPFHTPRHRVRREIHKITVAIGHALRFLDIDCHWDSGGTPGPFDLKTLEPCQELRHLVIRSVSSFVGTHPNLRFIDVWRVGNCSTISR